MPPRAMSLALALGVVAGGAVGAAAGWLAWGRPTGTLRGRLATLEAAATQVQGERERLRQELADIVRERREMATTAEHLRAQVERELERLEKLSAELVPPEAEVARPSGPTP